MLLFGSRRRSGTRTVLVALQVLLLLLSLIGPSTSLAATSPSLDVAPSHVPATGTHVFTALVRNIAGSPEDRGRCIRVITGSNVTVSSATFTVANPGTAA